MSADIHRLSEDAANVHLEEEVISFEGCQMKLDTAEDAQTIYDKIDACPSVTTLILKGNTINIEAAEKIAAALKKCSKLKRALWSDMFTGRSKTESPKALKVLCNALMEAGVSLIELDLSDNAFGPTGAEAIKNFLASPCSYGLRVLKLNNDGLGIAGGKVIAEALISCWKSSEIAGKPLSLEVFVAGRNRLENDGAKALAEAFKTIGTLKEVTLPQNGIYFHGIRSLAEAFACNPDLNSINLEDNTLSVRGAEEIAKVLPSLKRLQILNLNDCLLRNKVTIKLVEAIRHSCKNIEELLLGGNEIDKVAALEMGNAVLAKRSLRIIDFGGNNLGISGVEELLKLFEGNKVGERIVFSCEDEGSASEEETEDFQDVSAALEEIENEQEEEGYDEGLYALNEEEALYDLVDNFLCSFDPNILCELGREGPTLITERIKEDLENPYYGVFVLLKVASLITQECVSTDISEYAYLTCKILMFSQSSNFMNVLCQKLGLIKNEKGYIQGPKNLFGILHVLEEACHESCFKPICDILTFLVQSRKQDPNKDRVVWDNFLQSLSKETVAC